MSSAQSRRRPLTNIEFLMLRSLLRHQGWCTYHLPLWRFRAGRWDELSAWEYSEGPQGRDTWRKLPTEILPQRDKMDRMELAATACSALQGFGYVMEGPAGCCARHRCYRLTEAGQNFIERVDRTQETEALPR